MHIKVVLEGEKKELEVEVVHSRVNGAVCQEQGAAAAALGPSGPHSRPHVLRIHTIKAF